MKKLLHYLNPIAHLGEKRYSYLFPLITTLSISILLQAYFFFVINNPNDIGLYAITIFLGLIIYFSFRCGIPGGLIASTITIIYYLYLIKALHYTGKQYTTGIYTTFILGVLYICIALIIGWLKQTIDQLLENEFNERGRLETIIDQLPVGVLITDIKGSVQHNNKQMITIIGKNFPHGFTVGKNNLLRLKQNGELINPAHSPLALVLATGKPVIGKEYARDLESGKQGFLQINATPIYNKRGRMIAAASIVRDITEQKELEEKKDDFVNMASHELKTPITSLVLYSDALLTWIQKDNDQRSIKLVTNIKKQTDKLQELVNDLLDVSRIQTGKLSFKKEKFKLDILIEEIINELEGTAKQQMSFAKTSSIAIFADRFRIAQVITNLITNAIKYSPEESNIKIKIRKTTDKVIVSVQDFGIGIAKAQQDKIFNRLYQVNDDRGNTFPGFGMGLYISKEIVKRHRGSIWVESQKGKGSTFYFSLPIARK